MTSITTKKRRFVKHCPFCGIGNSACSSWFDDVEGSKGRNPWRCGCGRCCTYTNHYATEDEAIDAWNTRPDDDNIIYGFYEEEYPFYTTEPHELCQRVDVSELNSLIETIKDLTKTITEYDLRPDC